MRRNLCGPQSMRHDGIVSQVTQRVGWVCLLGQCLDDGGLLHLLSTCVGTNKRVYSIIFIFLPIKQPSWASPQDGSHGLCVPSQGPSSSWSVVLRTVETGLFLCLLPPHKKCQRTTSQVRGFYRCLLLQRVRTPLTLTRLCGGINVTHMRESRYLPSLTLREPRAGAVDPILAVTSPLCSLTQWTVWSGIPAQDGWEAGAEMALLCLFSPFPLKEWRGQASI